jgi:hypothetical protein
LSICAVVALISEGRPKLYFVPMVMRHAVSSDFVRPTVLQSAVRQRSSRSAVRIGVGSIAVAGVDGRLSVSSPGCGEVMSTYTRYAERMQGGA